MNTFIKNKNNMSDLQTFHVQQVTSHPFLNKLMFKIQKQNVGKKWMFRGGRKRRVHWLGFGSGQAFPLLLGFPTSFKQNFKIFSSLQKCFPRFYIFGLFSWVEPLHTATDDVFSYWKSQTFCLESAVNRTFSHLHSLMLTTTLPKTPSVFLTTIRIH